MPVFATIADRYGRCGVYIAGAGAGAGAVVGVLPAVPVFLSMQHGCTAGIVIFARLWYDVAHDMPVSVHQLMFTELFGTEYRYSGAGVGYQIASAIGGGFTPLIAAGLAAYGGGSWHWVAADLAGGCLVSGVVAATMRSHAASSTCWSGCGAVFFASSEWTCAQWWAAGVAAGCSARG